MASTPRPTPTEEAAPASSIPTPTMRAPSLQRGALIVIEGLDRSGKSTQVHSLATALDASRGLARVVKFPERTTAMGKMIDGYLQNKAELDDRAIHLLFSANRWELVPSILRDLEAGKHVICDRYAFSGIAYSCAKGLPFDWCLAPDAGLPLPDLTLFLSLSPEAAAQRAAYGEERYEVPALQAKVRTVFQRVGEEVKRRHGLGAGADADATEAWVEIDASRTKDEVAGDVLSRVQSAIAAVERRKEGVGKLFEQL